MICAGIPSLGTAESPLLPHVEIEETVYEPLPANNGAGPLWCYGSTCIVRRGDDVFVSGLETLPDAKPLNNCRWLLFQRKPDGWHLVQRDETGRQREPCPLGIYNNGHIFLSTNPTLAPPDAYAGPANPHLVRFSAADPAEPPIALQPIWSAEPGFSEHSYRGLGVDGPNGELVLLNIFAHEGQYWAFLDRRGLWTNRSVILFPIRGCYPQVALVNRVCHVLAIGDIVEPVEEWRKWKFETTKREWDYVFRRLFYAWNPDIAAEQFAKPLEIDNLDATAGHITNLDLWVDAQGDAHVLYRKSTVQSAAMRDRFFPGLPIVHSLERCVLREGRVLARHTLLAGGEKGSPEVPGWARFHATPDGRLFMFYHVSGTDSTGAPLNENRLVEVFADGTCSTPATVPLKEPLTNFMTATERGGSPPSFILDLLGSARGPALRYVRLRLAE